MCKNAEQIALSTFEAIMPTITALEKLEGVPQATIDQVAASVAAAETALKNWTPGTNAQVIIQTLNAVVAVLDTLPVSPQGKVLLGIIVSGVDGVILIVQQNSPQAPASAQVHSKMLSIAHAVHAAGVKTDLHAALTNPAEHYRETWNSACDKLGGKYLEAKQ